MGIPALRGGFLSGDDINLVRDHVLVNRPTWGHFIRLFTIEHRDLYQPVAMASFQLDFTIVRALGLQPTGAGDVPGTWVFHLTNVLLHGVCSVLVCALALRVTGRVAVAVVVGGLFALHPLNVEPVAWINGRMMLLSTLFLLAALLALERFGERGGGWRAALIIVLAGLCHMSKVRPELPVLLAIPLLIRGQWPVRRWWWVWGACSIVTAGFVVLNVGVSEAMIADGAEHLRGSRVARTVLALGWYLSRLIVPVGLSPYHPTPKFVDLSEPGLAFAGVVVVAALACVVASVRRTRLGWTGALWFLAAVAVTLPLTSARNLAVAERYMYLPLVGALWPIAALLVRGARRLPRAAVVAGGSALAIVLCGTSWYVIGYYQDDLAMTGRMAALYSRYPRMRLAHADALYRAGKSVEALAAAEALADAAVSEDAEVTEDSEVASEAWQVIGRIHARLGDADSSLAAFRRAVAIKPDSGLARVRLGGALLRAGRVAEAVGELERAAELAPLYNPGLHELARAYREVGRIADERQIYAQIETNNPYDVQAAVRLAEFDIAGGDVSAALPRVKLAASLVPEDTRVRALYAWALFLAGDWQSAAGLMERLRQEHREEPLARAVAVGIALFRENHQEAIARTTALADDKLLDDPSLFDSFAAVVQTSAERRQNDPWPYYVMALACHATQRDQAAHLAAEAFKQRMPDAEWHRRIDEIVGEGSAP